MPTKKKKKGAVATKPTPPKKPKGEKEVRTPPRKLAAAYSPEARPRSCCPLCFSRPDVSGRLRIAAGGTGQDHVRYGSEVLRERAWGGGDVVPKRSVQGRTHYGSQYPCSNPECLTILEVYAPLSGTAEHAEFVRAHRLGGEAATTFLTGGWDRKGVWRADPVLAQERERTGGVLQAPPAPLPPEPARAKAPPPTSSEPFFRRARRRKVRVGPGLELLERDLKDQLSLPEMPKKTLPTRRDGTHLLVQLPDPAPGFRRDRDGWVKVEYGGERYQALWEHVFTTYQVELP